MPQIQTLGTGYSSPPRPHYKLWLRLSLEAVVTLRLCALVCVNVGVSGFRSQQAVA